MTSREKGLEGRSQMPLQRKATNYREESYRKLAVYESKGQYKYSSIFLYVQNIQLQNSVSAVQYSSLNNFNLFQICKKYFEFLWKPEYFDFTFAREPETFS